jgi:hypothetical protein
MVWSRPPLDPGLVPHKYSNGCIHLEGLFITSDNSRIIKIHKTLVCSPLDHPFYRPTLEQGRKRGDGRGSLFWLSCEVAERSIQWSTYTNRRY